MPSLQEAVQILRTTKSPYFTLANQSGLRLALLQSWLELAKEKNYDLESNIIGNQTLDIGCGQGDMIHAFAAVLKAYGESSSKLIGVDPASLDYGSPWTLGQAQASLVASPVGEFISFKRTTGPELVLSQTKGTYSVAYFAISLYYFPSRAVLVQTFKALREAGIKTLLLAEWALEISRPAALSHLLAVLLQSVGPLPEGNVRTVLSPTAYIEVAKEAGWEVVGSKTFTPDKGVEDGEWETRMAKDLTKKRFAEEGALRVSGQVRSAEGIQLESLKAHAHALEASIPERGIKGVESMDIWTAVFKPAA